MIAGWQAGMPQSGQDRMKANSGTGCMFEATVEDAPAKAAVWSPLMLATLLAAGYCILCAVYIVLSTRGAAAISLDIPHMAGIETAKGIGFVILTGALFFAFSWVVLSQLEAERSRMRRQQRLIVTVDQRSIAGLFAGSIAHDINNLLTVAQCQLGAALDKVPKIEAADLADLELSLAEIARLSHRLSRIGQQPPRGEWATGNPADCVRHAIEICQQHVGVRRRQLATQLADVPPQSINALLVTRAVVNLILNSAEATRENGQIEVRLFREKDSTVIEVHDDGPGIPEKHAKLVFEEFYTTKPDGTGLGLFIVSVCAREHGGTVEVRPSPLGGACFRITLAEKPVSPPH